MTRSRYLLQIVDCHTGKAVKSIEPGSVVETDLITDFVTRASAKGVGFGRTSQQVEATLRHVWEELLLDLKSQVQPERPPLL